MLPTARQLNMNANVTVLSLLTMHRLSTQRSLILLVPPLLALAFVGFLALLCALMYRDSGLQEAKLGTTADIVMNTQTRDVRTVVEDVRAGIKPKSALEKMRLRYGRVADGFDGLSPTAKTRVGSFALRKQE